jgi:hypothetical protein
MTEKEQTDVLERALKAPWYKPLYVRIKYDLEICGTLIKYDNDTFVIDIYGWKRYRRKDENGKYFKMCLEGNNNSYDYSKERSSAKEILGIHDEGNCSYAGYWTKGAWA